MDHQLSSFSSSMANLSSSSVSSSFGTFFLILQVLLSCSLTVNGCYTSIISFGDSLADTGNLKQLSSYYNGKPLHFFFSPYGETFFHQPTGRCSNGRLIIDFIAESLGLPLTPPYVGGGGTVDLGQGVNYAVAGATALDSSFHEARGVPNPYTNASLGVQLGWFKQSLLSICTTPLDCKHLIQHSLILMGEIGGNDYNHALSAGTSLDEVQSYVPFVINTIVETINDLIELGAQTFVIPGNLPIGCSAAYLTMYYGSNEDYDNTTGCLVRLNKFAEYHNQQLQKGLNQIRELHPNVNIIYGDYYNAAMQFYRSPNDFGFSNGALSACCGGRGPFNYNASIECATVSSTTCDEPNTYVNWDGFHLTEAAYRLIYKSLFQGDYTVPQFNSLCPTMVQARGMLPSSI